MKKFENFAMSLENLNDIYGYSEPYSNVVSIGIVKLYEICFEQCWKAIKEVLQLHGMEESATGSPRQILKLAYKTGIIQDEAVWLSALESRNNVAHAYNRAIAIDIISETKSTYFQMFSDVKKKLEKMIEEVNG